MKFTQEDNVKLKNALAVCRKANIDHAVISEGKIRSLNEARTAAIFSELILSIDPAIQLGITRLGELEKRLTLFDTDVIIEGELTADKKVRKLSAKAKSHRIEFRCTDVALFDRKYPYPKASLDEPCAVITISKQEIGTIVRGVRTLGADQLTIQIKRDGAVHLESADSNNDLFEFDLEATAEFIEEPTSSVNKYITSSNGVLLQLLDHTARDQENTQLIMMKSGNVSMTVNEHNILIIPLILGA